MNEEVKQVTMNELLEYCAREIPDGMLYEKLVALRRKRWIEGQDYWVTEVAGQKSYRYDLVRCMEKLRIYAESRKPLAYYQGK